MVTALATLRERNLAEVEVAVVDSGMDASHPDLEGRIIAAVDVCSTGEARLVRRPPGSAADRSGHGTAVASVVLAVAPNARLVDVHVLGDDRRAPGSVLLSGLRYAIERGSRVINLSLAVSPRFADELRRLGRLADDNGQIIVAARRNFPLLTDDWPAILPTSITVEAGDAISVFDPVYRPGGRGALVASGEQVPVAVAGGGHALRDGTSYAAASVAGLCALVIGVDPDLSPREVEAVLRGEAPVP